MFLRLSDLLVCSTHLSHHHQLFLRLFLYALFHPKKLTASYNIFLLKVTAINQIKRSLYDDSDQQDGDFYCEDDFALNFPIVRHQYASKSLVLVTKKALLFTR